MRYSTQTQHLLGDHPPAESFGRIGRTMATRPMAQAVRSSANDADITSRDEGTASALRAFAANGFGDGAIERSGPAVLLTAVALDAAARRHRSHGIGELITLVWRAVVRRARRLVAEMQRSREEQSTYQALRRLDTRTLRDVGLDRSEIRSLARELADRHATRVHAQQSLRDRA
jgi:uncharacterized protein YjiS (DUF1127 family)